MSTVFLDTNILAYLFDAGAPTKQRRARKILEEETQSGHALHVHVERNDKIAKFQLALVRLQRSGGFGRAEIGRIQRTINEHPSQLTEAWNEYFGS